MAFSGGSELCREITTNVENVHNHEILTSEPAGPAALLSRWP